jgi:rod shape determining protein RodA
MLLAQIFINIGVNLRLFPVTGIPLPFISQGGSSLMVMFMAVGLLQSVLARRRPPGAGRFNRYAAPYDLMSSGG